MINKIKTTRKERFERDTASERELEILRVGFNKELKKANDVIVDLYYQLDDGELTRRSYDAKSAKAYEAKRLIVAKIGATYP